MTISMAIMKKVTQMEKDIALLKQALLPKKTEGVQTDAKSRIVPSRRIS